MSAGPIHDAALAWYDAGACVLPAATDGSKRPALAWDRYKTVRPGRGDVDTWGHAADGIGIVCGTVSGNVEMFEAEAVAVEAGMHTQLMEMLPAGLRDKLDTYVERSPKGGVHWIFRVDGMPVKGNTKLARRPGEVDAWSGKPGQSVEVLFETRGEGGWTVVAPSNGPTHPSGKPWQVVCGSAGVIPLLSAEEYRVLHACAATFDEMPQRFGGQAPGAVWVPPAASTAEGTPGQDFEAKATWEEILTPAGWQPVRRRGEVTEWVRPGKNARDGISATTGWQGDWLYVFSTSTEFESERTYTKFGAYCVAPETRVLKADLAWTQAGDLRAGDALVGVDEYIASKNGRRKLRLSYVESAERRTLPCYRITLADGRSIVASDEHPWLAASAGLGGNLRWIPTNRLRPGQRICSLTRGTWETATDFDSGWLSGMYDGEGWASGGIVGLSQKPGVVLDRAERLLRERGFSPSHKPVSTGSAENLTIASLPDILRLLGTLQPSRLVSKMQWIGRGAWTQAAPNAIVAAVEYVGERETAAFMTTARTFIAEGLVTHNTLLHHHGDFSAAAGELRKAGYGAKPEPPARPLSLVTNESTVPGIVAAPPVVPTPGKRKIVLADAPTKIKPVQWWWADRMPLGCLSLLAGREGIGKSVIAYDFAARLTRGVLPGKWYGTPRTVIICATEDSWAHTITPRLMAAGADLSRIKLAAVVVDETESYFLILPEDITGLEAAIKERGDVAMLLLDPLISRLDSKLDTHKDADVRAALEPLARLADRTGVGVFGLIHVNKGGGNDPLNALMASRAFSAVARAVAYAIVDRDDPGVRLLGCPKNNLGRDDLPSLRYSIEGVKVGHTDEGDVFAPRLTWGEEDERSVADVLADNNDHSGHEPGALDEAADWLTDYLIQNGGLQPSRDVKDAAKRAGHTEPTLKRAARRIKVEISQVGFPRVTYWNLPGGDVDPTADDSRISRARGASHSDPTVCEPTANPWSDTLFPVGSDNQDQMIPPVGSDPVGSTGSPPARARSDWTDSPLPDPDEDPS